MLSQVLYFPLMIGVWCEAKRNHVKVRCEPERERLEVHLYPPSIFIFFLNPAPSLSSRFHPTSES